VVIAGRRLLCRRVCALRLSISLPIPTRSHLLFAARASHPECAARASSVPPKRSQVAARCLDCRRSTAAYHLLIQALTVSDRLSVIYQVSLAASQIVRSRIFRSDSRPQLTTPFPAPSDCCPSAVIVIHAKRNPTLFLHHPKLHHITALKDSGKNLYCPGAAGRPDALKSFPLGSVCEALWNRDCTVFEPHSARAKAPKKEALSEATCCESLPMMVVAFFAHAARPGLLARPGGRRAARWSAPARSARSHAASTLRG
jgi:hypothetical protein